MNLAYNLEPIYSIIIAAILFGELREVNFSFWLGKSACPALHLKENA